MTLGCFPRPNVYPIRIQNCTTTARTRRSRDSCAVERASAARSGSSARSCQSPAVRARKLLSTHCQLSASLAFEVGQMATAAPVTVECTTGITMSLTPVRHSARTWPGLAATMWSMPFDLGGGVSATSLRSLPGWLQ